MKKAILLRGLPGSGKSTLTNVVAKGATVCSADYFFYFGKEMIPENYKFDPNLLGAAHGSCRKKFAAAIENQDELVVVDNTNIKLKDFKEYILTAAKAGYRIEIHSITGMSAEESFALNTHNVPLESCSRMLKAYSKCPNKIIVNDNLTVETNEIMHNYKSIRKGVLADGKFNQTNQKERKKAR